MPKMKAIVTNPQAVSRLELGDVDIPVLMPSQALVRVAAVSLNRGEVRGAMATTERYVPGWDLAGTVEKPAADGSGPKAGARVVGFLPKAAWAELAVVPTEMLAELPENVTFQQAAALPVAGLTALYVVQKGGGLLARNVLITGASGGVGIFAVQLARLSGANVVGLTNHAEYEPFLKGLGAAQVITGRDASGAAPFGPYRLIADGVGGAVLSSAFGLLAPGGLCVNFGNSGGAEVTFEPRTFFRAPGASFTGFLLFNEVKVEPASIGLRRLSDLIADGRLDPCIQVEATWDQIGDIARQLLDRKFPGKAVLTVS